MSEERGIMFAFVTALISGVSVFINAFAVSLADPFVYTTLKNLGAAIFLISAIYFLKERKQLLKLSFSQWSWLVAIGLIGGAVPFLLFFQGLSLISGIKGSFIYRTVFIFSAIFAFFVLKEKPSLKYAIGAGIFLLGNALLLGAENLFAFGEGELLVLAATAIWGLEYVLSKWLINSRNIAPRINAFGRMFFGTIFLFAFLGTTGRLVSIVSLSQIQIQWLLIASAFLFLFLSSWYAALKYAKASSATAVLALGGPITAMLNFMFLGKSPSIESAFGMLLMVSGIVAIVGVTQFSNSYAYALKELKKLRAWTA